MKLTLFAGIIFLIGFFMFGYYHELSHIAIYSSYGIESHAEYFSHFPDFVTIAEAPCPTEDCRLAHNYNEIIGYHLAAIYFIISIGLLLIVLLLELNLEIKLWLLKNG